MEVQIPFGYDHIMSYQNDELDRFLKQHPRRLSTSSFPMLQAKRALAINLLKFKMQVPLYYYTNQPTTLKAQMDKEHKSRVKYRQEQKKLDI